MLFPEFPEFQQLIQFHVKISNFIPNSQFLRMEADSPFWFDWRHHQSMNGIQQGPNGLIMGPNFSFQFDQLVSKLPMGRQIFSDPDKCSHHVNADFYRLCGIENTGCHDGAVLRKGVGKRAAAAAGVKFVFSDLRNHYHTSADRARELGLYRQNYCGCLFSALERAERRARRMIGKATFSEK